MSAEELRAWLVEAVAAATGAEPAAVRVDEPFAAHGLDSARLAQLAGDLERLLGRRVDPPVLFEHPTIGPAVRKLIEPALFDLPVLAFNELSATIRFEVVGQISLPNGMLEAGQEAEPSAVIAAE